MPPLEGVLAKARPKGGGALNDELMFFFDGFIYIRALHGSKLLAFPLLGIGHLLARAKTSVDWAVETDANGCGCWTALKGGHGVFVWSKKKRETGYIL